MVHPVYKIIVEDPSGPTTRHTITSEAIRIHTKHTLTNNIGTFNLTLPTQKDHSYAYEDIALNDNVKIWLGYETIPASPTWLMIAKVYQITGLLDAKQGCIRQILGRDKGEILQRRMKGEKTWSAGASTIVTEVATDLGLGAGEIAADASVVDYVIDHNKYETYMDLLKDISDYWVNAGTQVKKDFYVDPSNNLVWKARPIRTAGVETLTIGENILNYAVTQDLTVVKNKIHIYGEASKPYPLDSDGQLYGDTLTEDLTKPNNQLNHAKGVWTPYIPADETIAIETVTVHTGSKCVKSTSTAYNVYMRIQWNFSSGNEVNGNYYPYLCFTLRADSNHNKKISIVLVDGSSNTCTKALQLDAVNQWETFKLPIGKLAEESWTLPAGGTFDWTDIDQVLFDFHQNTSQYGTAYVDRFHFWGERWSDTADDATSQTNYGIREVFITDDELKSDGECQSRGEALLYMYKNPPIRIDVVTPGNTNILIGDRLSMTIPAEGISSSNFDVVTVEHFFGLEGFTTKATMINSLNLRYPPVTTLSEILINQHNDMRVMGKGWLIK